MSDRSAPTPVASRRTFVRAGIGLATLGGLGAVAAALGPGRRALGRARVRSALQARFPQIVSAVVVGRLVLPTLPPEARAEDALWALLFPAVGAAGLPGAERAAARDAEVDPWPALLAAAAADGAAGRVLRVGGWTLARTEAHLYAFLAARAGG